jgi:hypothetical protein
VRPHLAVGRGWGRTGRFVTGVTASLDAFVQLFERSYFPPFLTEMTPRSGYPVVETEFT